MRHILQFLVVFLAVLPSSSPGDVQIRSVSDVSRIISTGPAVWDPHCGKAFELTGMIAKTNLNEVILSDGTGGTLIVTKLIRDRMPELAPGDIVRAACRLGMLPIGHPVVFATDIRVLRHEPAPAVRDITGAEFASGRFDYTPVRLRGRVLDVLVDEIDPMFAFMILDCDGQRVLCPDTRANAEPHFGRRVEVTGLGILMPPMSRQLTGRILNISEIRDLDDRKPDPFDTPELTDSRLRQPTEIASLGRHRLHGRVLAVWNHSALVRTTENLIAKIDLANGDKPSCGDAIEAAGLPEMDAFTLILRHACWRKAAGPVPEAPGRPVDVPFTSIFLDAGGVRRLDSLLHGKPIRTTATVRSLPSAHGPVDYMLVGTEDWLLPVDISAAAPRPHGLSVGCSVELTGIYLLECQPWRPNMPIPPVDGVRLIVRSPDDIRILAAPSWWTAARLAVVVGVLTVGLVFILIWNLSLQRLAERRGRKLSDERIARAEAEIKTMERTRLAVELHDTIAQNLTGVSIALDTARQFCQATRPELMQQIDIADATLDSCQTELRNCLWDLRNQTLEENNLNTAIRTALLPHVTDAALNIRFNVCRDRLTENTAHTIIRIIRELVINAIRHGHATHIQIAGALDPDALRFSVMDNGCGFDANACPGVAQQHFGLQGIRERLSLLGGKLLIDSAHGSGSRIVVTIPLPSHQEQSHTP